MYTHMILVIINLLILHMYGKCAKILNTFIFCYQIKCWLSGLELTKCLSEKQTGKTLGLYCFLKPFRKATSVQNFRTFTVILTLISSTYHFCKVHNLYRAKTSKNGKRGVIMGCRKKKLHTEYLVITCGLCPLMCVK